MLNDLVPFGADVAPLLKQHLYSYIVVVFIVIKQYSTLLNNEKHDWQNISRACP